MTQWRLDIPDLLGRRLRRTSRSARVAQPADIADAISVLASGQLGYMNGNALIVDGGWTAV